MTHIPVQNAQHLAQEVLRRSARHVDQMERELRRHDCADPECQLHVAGQIQACEQIATAARQASRQIEVVEPRQPSVWWLVALAAAAAVAGMACVGLLTVLGVV